MPTKKAKEETDEQTRSEVDSVEARAYAEDSELGDDDLGEDSDVFQTLDDGEKAVERGWDEHLKNQTKASQPPADDEPDTAKEARGEKSEAKANEEPDAGPDKETPADQDTTPKYGGGRYNSLEEFEQGHHELRGTLTRMQQENAALKSQIVGGAQAPQAGQQRVDVKDLIGSEVGGKTEALLADEEFQRLLDIDSTKAIPKLLKANQDDTIAKFMAVLSVADAQTGKRRELGQTQATIKHVGEAYIKEKHEILQDEALGPIVENIGHRLVGTGVPDHLLTGEQAYWRRMASSGPQGLHKYLDKVAELTKQHPVVVRMNAAGQAAEVEEDLKPPRTMRPGSTQVRPQAHKEQFDDDDFDDFAREKAHNEGLWT